MKKLGLIILVSVATTGVSVLACDYSPAITIAYTWPWSERLDAEINHLNRMRGHVRWQLHYYQARANSAIRRDFARISREVDHINAQFRNRDYDRRHLRAEVERAHADLHDIETRLRVRTSDYYRWH